MVTEDINTQKYSGPIPDIRRGEIVQLDPEKTSNKAFAGCLMVVTDYYSWGVQGYVQALGTREEHGGQAYYRAEWGTFQTTGGFIQWAPKDEFDNGDDETDIDLDKH